jgi:hypothetical protein
MLQSQNAGWTIALLKAYIVLTSKIIWNLRNNVAFQIVGQPHSIRQIFVFQFHHIILKQQLSLVFKHVPLLCDHLEYNPCPRHESRWCNGGTAPNIPNFCTT